MPDVELHSIASPTLWAVFAGVVAVLLAIDLGAFNKHKHIVSFKEALSWTAVWIIASALFCALLIATFGPEVGLEYASGYLLEKALSVDNIFVFILIFRAFSVPPDLHHRVLFWGVLGAVLLRAFFIFLGSALVQSFHVVLYIFGALLIVTAIRLLKEDAGPEAPTDGWFVRMFRRIMPMTDGYRGAHFLFREDGKLRATPLLLALIVVEVSDVIFAFDSIPAIFAVTQDPFIIYTSNIFAILGLRSLYFVLAGMMLRFRYLHYGLGAVLLFVGAKLLLVDVVHIPNYVSLLVIVVLITGASLFSLKPPRTEKRQPGDR